MIESAALELMYGLDAENPEHRLTAFLEDQFESWKYAVQEIKRANSCKAFDLFLGQVFILAALLFLFIATIVIVVP